MVVTTAALPELLSPSAEPTRPVSELGSSIRYCGTIGFGLATLALPGGSGRFEQMLWLNRRSELPAAAFLPSSGTERWTVRLGNFRGEWLWHDDLPTPWQRQDCALLYFHGGGYISGGLNTHRRLVAKIARASGMPAFNVVPAFIRRPFH